MPNSDSKYQSLPIRAIFQGEKMDSTGKWNKFELQKEFYRFRTNIKDYEVFRVNTLFLICNFFIVKIESLFIKKIYFKDTFNSVL